MITSLNEPVIRHTDREKITHSNNINIMVGTSLPHYKKGLGSNIGHTTLSFPTVSDENDQ